MNNYPSDTRLQLLVEIFKGLWWLLLQTGKGLWWIFRKIVVIVKLNSGQRFSEKIFYLRPRFFYRPGVWVYYDERLYGPKDPSDPDRVYSPLFFQLRWLFFSIVKTNFGDMLVFRNWIHLSKEGFVLEIIIGRLELKIDIPFPGRSYHKEYVLEKISGSSIPNLSDLETGDE